jgi:hypothetical protein
MRWLAAVIAFMASPAWAETTAIPNVTNSLPVTIAMPPKTQFCEQGWTMVMVARSWHGGAGLGSTYDTVPKCAPVGDLKDPEEK